MYFSWVYGIFLLMTILNVQGAIPEDSFDESFEKSSTNVRKPSKPTEDAFLTFLNRLVNTGYSSSKIALSRIEKASQRRKDFENQLEKLLINLPAYEAKISSVIEQYSNKKKPEAGVYPENQTTQTVIQSN